MICHSLLSVFIAIVLLCSTFPTLVHAKHAKAKAPYSKAWFLGLEDKHCAKPQRRTQEFHKILVRLSSLASMPSKKEERYVGIPSRCPSSFVENGLQFINISPVAWRHNELSPGGTMELGYNPKQAVGAIGGVIDNEANAQNRSIGYMALAPGKKTHYFDLHGFNFWCTDRFKIPKDCSIGVATTTERGFNQTTDRPAIFHYRAGSIPSRPQPALLPPGKSHGLRLVSIGLPLASLDRVGAFEQNGKDLSDEEHRIAQDYDLNPDRLTVYVDGFSYFIHKCHRKEPAHPYNGGLTDILNYPGCMHV